MYYSGSGGRWLVHSQGLMRIYERGVTKDFPCLSHFELLSCLVAIVDLPRYKDAALLAIIQKR